MSRKIAIPFLLLAWLCANGALWDAMQLVAWGRMFATYSETMNVTQALKETFDPSKPCEMCQGIAKAKTVSESKSASTDGASVAKFVLTVHAVETPVFENDPGDWRASPLLATVERTDPVPLPPPRV